MLSRSKTVFNKSSFKAFIFDLDGTIYMEEEPIGNIVNQINELSMQGIQVFMLTNNTQHPLSFYKDRLANMKFDVSQIEILNPTQVAISFLKTKYKKGFVLGTSSFCQDFFEQSKIKEDQEDPEFILVAFDTTLDYEKLKKTSLLIQRGIPFYQTHIDKSCPTKEGLIPDCGAIVKLLEETTQQSCEGDFGKPSHLMIQDIQNRLGGVNFSQVLFAGDRLTTDICMGRKMKAHTLLVLSGETKKEDLEHCSIENQPHDVAETLSDFLASL